MVSRPCWACDDTTQGGGGNFHRLCWGHVNTSNRGCIVLCVVVLFCVVLCCVVLCCVVLCCVVLWCGLVWCGVLCCGVVCCVCYRLGT